MNYNNYGLSPEVLKRLQDITNQTARATNSISKAMKPLLSTLKVIDDASAAIMKNLKPISDSVSKILPIVSKLSKQYATLEKLQNAQYVCWDYFDADMTDLVLSIDDTNEALQLYHEKENYESVFKTAEKCLDSPMTRTNRLLFKQSLDAFSNDNSDLASVGIIATIDGALDSISDNPKIVNIKRRANPLLEKMKNEEELDKHEATLIFLLQSFEKALEMFAKPSEFDKPEPNFINRHWIMHGRSKRRKTKLDCVKLINFLYGIILLDELSKSDNTGE